MLQIFVLSIVQGITEFLPISSSAHLILVPLVVGWPDQGLLIDVAVHIGSLGAVIVYFWRELWEIVRDLLRGVSGGAWDAPGVRLFAQLVVATLPVVAVGLLVRELVELWLRSAALIGWTTLLFGLVLHAADRAGGTARRLEQMTMRRALAIGCAQTLALIPGVSRSGITITAARLLGFERRDAARFSLLLSIPTTAAAGVLLSLELVRAEAELQTEAALGIGLSFIAALAAIAGMMHWLRRATFAPFVVYRVVLGTVLLVWIYT